MPLNENIQRIEHASKNLRKVVRKPVGLKCLEAFINAKLEPGSYMSWEQLKKYVPAFVNATWAKYDFTDEEREDIVLRMFKGEHLPGGLETFCFTFRLKGLTYIEVSHFLRHREATFSARCTGDNNLSEIPVMVPEAIMNSPEFLERYEKICQESYDLYCDIVECGKISTMDARYVLPKASEQEYFMSVDWRSLVKIIYQRQDVNIQPKSDNLLAYDMMQEIVGIYPKLKEIKVFDVDMPNKFYQLNARKPLSTNLYYPAPQDDVFEWRNDDFVYQCTREELNGTHPDPRDNGQTWFSIRQQKTRNVLNYKNS